MKTLIFTLISVIFFYVWPPTCESSFMSAAPSEKDQDSTPPFDPIKLAQIMRDVMDRAQPIMEEAAKNFAENNMLSDFDPFNIQDSYTEFLNSWAKNPEKLAELQMNYWTKWSELWQESSFKFLGEETHDLYAPQKGDKRFKSDLWSENVFYDFIKQSYLMTAGWMQEVVQATEGLSDKDLERLDFYTRQFADALAPTNFVMTNPDVMRETLETGGENLVRGLQNMLDDMKRGGGKLKISMTDYNAFKLGENIATTPGDVVYQNDVIQLIQYAPSTDKVFQTPLLIIPPWINKYYILDLRPENSLIKWLVDQGHTVFCISWVNPTQGHADKGFDDYIDEGFLAALNEIEAQTDAKETNVIGYCIGGTLLTMGLSYLTAKGEAQRVKSATFLTTLVDFEEAGELKLFTDAKSIAKMSAEMQDKGILDASHLQRTFSMLRANDLIWSFVINNYLMGKEPFPFDLLYWNDDSTNMPAKLHSDYLRNMYCDNLLVQDGALSVHDTLIDIRTIETPSYFLSTRDDHIAPWRATYATTQYFKGPKTFTLSASGHIAGVVNSPSKEKYCYWVQNKTPETPDQWLDKAKEHKGSWWPHWQKWVEDYTGNKVKARKAKNSLEPAPGSYVKA